MKQAIIAAAIVLIPAFIYSGEPPKVDLGVGDKAPLFQARDDAGKNFDSKLYLGKRNLVVYFYPAAMTGGCTAQACSYSAGKKQFEDLDTIVVALSGDPVQNLAWFKQAHDLKIPLLADPDGSIAKAFGVPFGRGGEIVRKVAGKDEKLVRGETTARWTFVIDKKGKIAYKDTSVQAGNDSKEVLAFLEKRKR